MKKVLRAVVVFLSIILILQIPIIPSAAAISSGPVFSTVGSIGGPTTAIGIKGSYAYVGQGPAIIVFEQTKEGLIQKRAQINLPDIISDIEIQDNTLYAAASFEGIHIIDISDPLKPVKKGNYNASGKAEAIEVRGSTLYLAGRDYGVQIIDVSNPVKPAMVGQVYKGKCALGLNVSGGTAYIAAGNDGLLVADISQSKAPKEMSIIKTPGIARDVVVKDTYAFVADDWKGVCMIDVTSIPSFVKSIDTSGRIYGLSLEGNYLYAADADGGLKVLNITNPMGPVEISGELQQAEGMTRVVTSEGTAYCVNRGEGILCYDISDPSHLALKEWEFGLFSHQIIDMAVRNQYAYVICENARFSIIDMKNTAMPLETAHLDFGDAMSFIRVNGDYAYLFSKEYLYAVNKSDPLKPVCENVIMTRSEGIPTGADIDSNCLYLVSGNILQIFSVSIPSEPVLISSYYIQDAASGELTASDIEVRNGIAYISMGYKGIYLYDVSAPGKIKSTGKYFNANRNYDQMDFYDKLVIVNSPDDNSAEIIDISEIKKPKHAGVLEAAGLGNQSAMYRNFALFPVDAGGILAADLSAPSDIKETKKFNTTGVPERILVEGSKAYVTDKSGTVSIIEISDPSPTPLPNLPSAGGKIAYITIDDGPSANNTPKILDTLKAYDIKATFFVLPKSNADDLYKRIIGEGHVIGNHSYSHDYGYLYSSLDQFRKDVIKARDFISSRLGCTSTVFRFPGGAMGRNKEMIKERAELLKELGYAYFDWDVSTADTDTNLKNYGSEDDIVNLLANNVINHTNGKNKLIVLMHDSSDKVYTVKALPKIIEGLQKKGYRFDVLTNY